MKKLFSILVIIILAGCLGYFAWDFFTTPKRVTHVANPDTERLTTQGKVLGYLEDNQTHAWLGIPFARPPVGELRWKAPLPPEARVETLKALDVCDVCPQYGGPLSVDSKKQFDTPVGSEDCLYLNIFAPAFSPNSIPNNNANLPVLMWIHGGGNSVGHGGYYSGKFLAEKYNVIVVTINYRLGPLGWFSHPALKANAESPLDRSGNYGTLDIIRALTWIRDNIPNFGGDPANVTVFGESAGAVDTLSMMLSPYAKGLFHKAAVQSGMARVTPVTTAENYMDDPVAAGHPFSSREVLNRLLMADHNLPDRKKAADRQDNMNDDEIAAYLRSKSSADILRVFSSGPFGMISFPALIQDGDVLPKGNPLAIFRDAKKYNPVPMIIGTNRDEFKIFMAQNPEFVNRYLGFIVRFIDEKYYELFARYRSDLWKAVGVDEIASKVSRSGGEDVYAYRFDWDEEPTILGMDFARLIGAAHGLEIPFVFNSFNTSMGLMKIIFTEENLPGRRLLADHMSSYWVQFARTGNPGKGVDGRQFEWQAWDGDNPNTGEFIVFDTPVDGGIRMSSETIRIIDIKSRIMSDATFADQKQRCSTYVSLFKNTPLWNDEEYSNLGGDGCENQK
jgi:para-nitrobenzyl esterase